MFIMKVSENICLWNVLKATKIQDSITLFNVSQCLIAGERKI